MGGGAPPKVSPGENAPWYTPTYDGAPPPIVDPGLGLPGGYTPADAEDAFFSYLN